MILDESGFERLVLEHRHPEAPPGDIRPAAVNFLLDFSSTPELLAILKAPHPSYPWGNQVALPGGHVDPEDASPAHAALRELMEEMAIPEEQVRVVGSMGHFMTIRNVCIEVIAGVWNGKGPIRFDPHEIARVIRVPVPALMEAHIGRGFTDRQPALEELLYPAEDQQIWGATARIVHYFLERLRCDAAAA